MLSIIVDYVLKSVLCISFIHHDLLLVVLSACVMPVITFYLPPYCFNCNCRL